MHGSATKGCETGSEYHAGIQQAVRRHDLFTQATHGLIQHAQHQAVGYVLDFFLAGRGLWFYRLAFFELIETLSGLFTKLAGSNQLAQAFRDFCVKMFSQVFDDMQTDIQANGIGGWSWQVLLRIPAQPLP